MGSTSFFLNKNPQKALRKKSEKHFVYLMLPFYSLPLFILAWPLIICCWLWKSKMNHDFIPDYNLSFECP
jgi:hypothetical protein